ncbi:MAG: SIMPL domain-containing protein [Clostridia bacterium]
MEIMVEGKGQKFYKPNQITINFNFENLSDNYETALADGVQNVENYVNMLSTLTFDKKNVKTLSFKVGEAKHYDELTRKYVLDGYLFNQNAILKFDYKMSCLSQLMEKTSKFKNPPKYTISFGIKNSKKIETNIIELAYQNAEFQANAIAKSCGKKIKECLKISFEPFEDKLISNTNYCRDGMQFKCGQTQQSIENVFVPEDIEINKTIFCQFVAQ